MKDTMLHYEQTDAGLGAQSTNSLENERKGHTKQVICRPDGMQDTKNNARDNRNLLIFRDWH